MTLTRRSLLAGAAVAPAALAAAPALATTLQGDAATLTALLRLEQAAELTYRAAARSQSADVRAIAESFAPHEAAHVAAIATSLEALGAPKLPPPRRIPAVDALARDLGISPVLSEVQGPQQTLRFVLALERHLVAEWTAAHRRLADARLLQTATTILGCQAQHLVVLRQALELDPLPDAFEAPA